MCSIRKLRHHLKSREPMWKVHDETKLSDIAKMAAFVSSALIGLIGAVVSLLNVAWGK
jgi:hypothetical protein